MKSFKVRKKQKVESIKFISLPNDLILHTLSFLKPEELRLSQSISKEFKSLAQEPELWVKQIKKEAEAAFEMLSDIFYGVYRLKSGVDQFIVSDHNKIEGFKTNYNQLSLLQRVDSLDEVFFLLFRFFNEHIWVTYSKNTPYENLTDIIVDTDSPASKKNVYYNYLVSNINKAIQKSYPDLLAASECKFQETPVMSKEFLEKELLSVLCIADAVNLLKIVLDSKPRDIKLNSKLLHVACRYSSMKSFKLLLSYGADVNFKIKTVRSNHSLRHNDNLSSISTNALGALVFFRIYEKTAAGKASVFSEYKQMVDILLDNGANPDVEFVKFEYKDDFMKPKKIIGLGETVRQFCEKIKSKMNNSFVKDIKILDKIIDFSPTEEHKMDFSKRVGP